MAEIMRLDRFLCECGTGTRSEVKNYIKKKRVSVNGSIVADAGMKVDALKDTVMFDGALLSYEKFRYFMLNKPAGCVSATRDGLSSTVLDLLEGEVIKGLFPVGRLDKDTEGFLLITNDGQLGHNLLSPKKHVDKTYLAVTDKTLSDAQMEEFRAGLDIGDDEPTMPAEISFFGETEDGRFVFEVVLHEGRFHQVKRMFEHFGSTVTYLKRTAMGAVELDDGLEPGEYRRLTDMEISLLKGESEI